MAKKKKKIKITIPISEILRIERQISRELWLETGGHDGRFAPRIIPDKKKEKSRRRCREKVQCPLEPSGVFCAACQEEIDLWDGPVRIVGKPKSFPFCWKCWRLLYPACPQCDIVAKDTEDGKLHIYLEENGGW